MSHSDMRLRMLAVHQYLAAALECGLTPGERMDQLRELATVIRTGHIPEAVFSNVEADIEESDPDGYSNLVRGLTDEGLATTCQLMMGGLADDGYDPRFVVQCRDHFAGCPLCRSEACGLIRSNEVSRASIRNLLALLPEPELSEEAYERILANVLCEIDKKS